MTERHDVARAARRCACTRPIPYEEPGGDRNCAKCGRTLEHIESTVTFRTPSEGEDRVGQTLGPGPAPAVNPPGFQRARPATADPPPASQVVCQAGSGPILEWPFRRAAARARRERP